ncbi:MAG TPA: hypothetical protein VIQ30_09790 [Pseudonocardia sp.]
MSEPIPFRVTRYRCPHCPRTASSKARTVEHIGRCWRNPAARGCKTCKHFDNTYEDYGEDCAAGVDLAGRPACPDCHGTGYAAGFLRLPDDGTKCPTCKGDAAEIKPGPIVGCEKWEAADAPA